jgi:hypothetical protein
MKRNGTLQGGRDTDRRTFLKAFLAGGGLTFFESNSYALKLFPNRGKQKWAVLFGSRYGSTRDAGLWISEGMGGIADAFDVRENPDLSSFESIIVGSGIYSQKIDQPLEAYLAGNAALISGKIKTLFVVCGAGDSPRGARVSGRSCKILSDQASSRKGIRWKDNQETPQQRGLHVRGRGLQEAKSAI